MPTDCWWIILTVLEKSYGLEANSTADMSQGCAGHWGFWVVCGVLKPRMTGAIGAGSVRQSLTAMMELILLESKLVSVIFYHTWASITATAYRYQVSRQTGE